VTGSVGKSAEEVLSGLKVRPGQSHSINKTLNNVMIAIHTLI
jgi:hypothetical protein